MSVLRREVGRCLTESKLADLSEVKNRFTQFVIVSQFLQQPKNVSEVEVSSIFDKFSLSIGMLTYGVESDGLLTWLGEIVDSSD